MHALLVMRADALLGAPEASDGATELQRFLPLWRPARYKGTFGGGGSGKTIDKLLPGASRIAARIPGIA